VGVIRLCPIGGATCTRQTGEGTGQREPIWERRTIDLCTGCGYGEVVPEAPADPEPPPPAEPDREGWNRAWDGDQP